MNRSEYWILSHVVDAWDALGILTSENLEEGLNKVEFLYNPYLEAEIVNKQVPAGIEEWFENIRNWYTPYFG